MSRQFENILVTGANRGIGLEFVKQYLSEATHIYACCRTPENAHELLKLGQQHSNIEIISLDVTKQKQIQALQQRLTGRKLDLLINNAGISRGRGERPLDKNDWLETFSVNTLSPIHLSTALLPHMTERNAVIANITSKMGSIEDNTSGGAIIYRSSKAALNAATKSFAIDNRAAVTTVLLHPGWVKTDMGGPNALIDVQTSIRGMRNILANVTPERNGFFCNYDGTIIPW